MELKAGTLLAGRVRYTQAREGYRTGIEPVLLAAACPARGGDRVLELGTGAGAALLCLTARVPSVSGLGVELDPGLASLARHNLAVNGAEGVAVVEGDAAGFTADAPFDHAISNPPWHGAASTPSPELGRRRAKQGAEGLVEAWCRAASRALRHGGTLTLVLPAALVGEVFRAFAKAGLGGPALFPLWPREGQVAKLVLVQARRGARGPARVLPGAVLHAGAGWSAWADGVLRGGEAILLGEGDRSRSFPSHAGGTLLRSAATREEAMLVVTVLYPGSGGETFDYDYYLSKHMPLVHARWDGMGLQGAQVLRGQPGPDGGKPMFSTITLLSFESAAAFKAAADAHGAEIFADIPKFTNGQPTVQLNEPA